MADTLQFELVSPERLVLSQAVEMVVVPGGDGDFGALPQHAPLISTVRPGVIDVYNGGRVVEKIFVAGGFAEVTPERCTVLAEEAVAVAELNQAAVSARLDAAEKALNEAADDHARAMCERTLAVAQAMAAALNDKSSAH